MKSMFKFVAAILAFLAGAVPASAQVLTNETYSAYVGTLPTTSTFGTTDKIPILQGGISKALQLSNPVFVGGLTVGQAGVQAGQMAFAGGSTGLVTLLAATNAGTYTVTLPTSGGLPGQTMLSSGGGATPLTWATPRLAGRNIAARFGSMDVFQRGASIAIPASTTTGAYTVDGCYVVTNVNQTSTVNSVTGIAVGSNRAAQVFRNSGQTGTGIERFGCPFDTDEIALMQGNFVTLSFTFSTGANFSSTTTNMFLVCGTGAPVRQIIGYTGQTVPITVNLPAAANSPATRYQGTTAAIIPANCTQTEVQIQWTPSGTAGAVDAFTIDDLQVEVVPAATSVASLYDQRTFEEQLHLAQRFYAKTFTYTTTPAQNAGGLGALLTKSITSTTGTENLWWRFPRSLRAAPTTTVLFNTGAANGNCRDTTNGTDGGAASAASADSELLIVACTASGTGAVNDLYAVHATVDAGI